MSTTSYIHACRAVYRPAHVWYTYTMSHLHACQLYTKTHAYGSPGYKHLLVHACQLYRNIYTYASTANTHMYVHLYASTHTHGSHTYKNLHPYTVAYKHSHLWYTNTYILVHVYTNTHTHGTHKHRHLHEMYSCIQVLTHITYLLTKTYIHVQLYISANTHDSPTCMYSSIQTLTPILFTYVQAPTSMYSCMPLPKPMVHLHKAPTYI